MRTTTLALMLCSCASLTPRVQPEAPPQHSTPQAQADGLKVWANTALWVGAPQDVESYVMPIGVEIENETDQPIAFNLDDVRVADDQNNQAAPFFTPFQISTPYAINPVAMREKYRRNPPPLRLMVEGEPSTAFLLDHYRTPALGLKRWQDFTGLSTLPPRDWVNEVRFVGMDGSLSSMAINDRPIAAHGRVSGFLYFPRVAQEARKVRLSWQPQGATQPLTVDFSVTPRT